MTDATGTTTWGYADGLHLSVLNSPVGGLSYWYDPDGRRTEMEGFIYGIGDVSYWNYGYDNGGRLSTLRSTVDGTTTFAYDAADRVTQKTKGDGDYETYGYDVASQMTGIGYYWLGGIYRNGHSYTYDAAGNLSKDDQGWYATAYGNDGAGQLTSETSINGNGYSPPALAFTYDQNGNRLTQTSNGSVVQSFTYDAHDKLASGTGETATYDLNGSLKSDTLTGQSYTYDDEDRLLSASGPGYTDTFSYNGLGLRVGKTDSTGTYSYVCDGASPGAPVLWDGHAVYTPGQSENRGGVSSYPAFDRIGNLWTQDASPQSQLFYEDTTGFGSLTFLGGTNASPFKFGGGNGCQTDADTGLVLMGHRYYDTRTGRFISQDPAHDGGNWYAYVGNNPVNHTDPTGLQLEGGGPSPFEQMAAGGASTLAGNLSFLDQYDANNKFEQAQNALQSTITLSQKKAVANEGQSTNLYLGMVFDFFGGTGASVRNYGPDSTQVLTFLQSMDAEDLFDQLAAQGFSKKATGGVGSVAAAFYSFCDPFNGSQGHMGAFDWHVESKVGNNLNVVVHNDMSRASFLGGNAFGFGVSNPASGPQRTITEYLHFTVPIPRR